MPRDARVATIAKETGVSVATVSRVLNNHAYVAEKTRSRVLRALARKQKLPRLRRAQNSHLAIVIEALNPDIHPLDSYTEALINGAVGYLFDLGVDVGIMVDHRKRLERRNLVKEFSRKQAFGALFILPESGVTYSDQLAGEGFPYIAVGRTGAGTNYVACDQVAGVAAALDHLHEQGHSRIGFLGGMRGVPDHDMRFEGFKKYMKKTGGYDPISVVYGPESRHFKETRGYDEMLAILDRAPHITAVLANDDSMALGAMRALNEKGRRLPDHMAIVGFDDEEYSRFLTPSLSTVRQPLAEMGRFAAMKLLEMSKTGFARVRKTFSPELIVRESSVRSTAR